MNIVITGANGYIGSVLSKKLPQAKLYDIDEWDIRCDDVEDLSVDVVVHLAALVKVGESVIKPWQYYETNVTGTYNVIQAFPRAKMIFASTGAASNPVSPYGMSKVMAEEVVKQYCSEYTIFRFYNVGGGTPTNPEGLYAAVKKAEESGEFTIFGGDYPTKDGTPVRDYIHVEDLTDAIVNAVHKPAAMTDYEPLGSGQSYTVKEYLDAYLEKNGPRFVYKIGDRREGDLAISEVPFMSKFMTPRKTLKDIV
jgi:UDP-glucose 4-epimerase